MTITKEDLQDLAALLREPVTAQPVKPKESFSIRLAAAALVIAVVAAVAFATLNFFAPVLVGMPQPPPATALPAVRPTMAPAQQYQAPPAPPQEEIAPAAPVIVVTPTYSTGCHDGVSYIDGIPTNGTCAGAAFVGEAATETDLPTPTIAPATAVPPDPTYMDALRKQAPHCIRCAP